MFKTKKIMMVAALVFFALGIYGCGSGGGGSSSGGSSGGGTNNGSTSVIQGTLKADNPSDYTVFNSSQNVPPSTDGGFNIAVSDTKPIFTYAISSSGNKVYAAVSTNADGSMTIDAQSTAEALVLLNPLLIPANSAEHTNIINTVKSNEAVKSLASVIETVYASVEDPLSDEQISNATAEAVKSVLNSLQPSATSAKSLSPHAQKAKGFTILSYSASNSADGGSSIQVHNYDMGALTLNNSSGSNLKIELDDSGTWGITTNVDWVVRIVELDSTKVQWFNNTLSSFNPDNVDSVIKTGGYDQNYLVEGQVGSGWLEWATDPFETFADSIATAVFPDEGIALPHDGVYAVIAFSGTWKGDDAEYSAVKNSQWQYDLWKQALLTNILCVSVDSVALGTAFAGVDVSPYLDVMLSDEVLLGYVKTVIDNDISQLSQSDFISLTAYVTESLLTSLKPYIHSGISELQSSGIKKFFHIAVNTAGSILDVWSGTISVSTRVGNFFLDVTPRESGYGVLGAVSDTTAPSTPTNLTATAVSTSQINLSWTASPESDVAGYRILRNGGYLTRVATTSTSDTGLSASIQYCYTVSAYDTSNNASGQSSSTCATTSSVGTAPSAPTGVSASAGDGQVTISWSAATGATSYNIYWSNTSGVTKTNGTKIAGVTSPYTHTGRTNGTTYYYVVTAVNSYGESSESSQVSATTNGTGGVSLSW